MYNSPGETKESEKIVHKLNNVAPHTQLDTMSMKKILSIFLLVILFGVISGFAWAYMSKNISSENQTPLPKAAEDVNVSPPPKRAGIDDKKTFKDTTEGIMRDGGIEGEGDYHLERPGGTSQNVYLTSTTVDLSRYIGKKVKVWGETYSAQKAGWLMDVGLIELSQ